MLLGVVMGLHAYNTWREANRIPEDATGLPEGAARRLPDGRLLMTDGSIRKSNDTSGPTLLHKVKEVGEDELVLDKLWRKFKDSV
jgi:hypothetical protein